MDHQPASARTRRRGFARSFVPVTAYRPVPSPERSVCQCHHANTATSKAWRSPPYQWEKRSYLRRRLRAQVGLAAVQAALHQCHRHPYGLLRTVAGRRESQMCRALLAVGQPAGISSRGDSIARATPEAGVTVSQSASLLTCHVRLPLPTFVTASASACGVLPRPRRSGVIAARRHLHRRAVGVDVVVHVYGDARAGGRPRARWARRMITFGARRESGSGSAWNRCPASLRHATRSAQRRVPARLQHRRPTRQS